VARHHACVDRAVRCAESEFTVAQRDGRQRLDARWWRFEAGHGDAVGGWNQDEVARQQLDRLVSVDRDTAPAVEDHAIERLAGIRAANAPGARAEHEFGEPGTRLQQRHDFGQRIDHRRTPANETWMIDCSEYGLTDLSLCTRQPLHRISA
jgi:hypothetical protein